MYLLCVMLVLINIQELHVLHLSKEKLNKISPQMSLTCNMLLCSCFSGSWLCVSSKSGGLLGTVFQPKIRHSLNATYKFTPNSTLQLSFAMKSLKMTTLLLTIWKKQDVLFETQSMNLWEWGTVGLISLKKKKKRFRNNQSNFKHWDFSFSLLSGGERGRRQMH